MPFKKVGAGDYTSPSGRNFNQAQVNLYDANGGKFRGEKKAGGGLVMFNQDDRQFEEEEPDLATTKRRRYAKGGPVEGSAADVKEDKIGAKKAGLSMKDWEASPADRAHDRNRGFHSKPVQMAAGGPVLGRTHNWSKGPDEFTGGRMPLKPAGYRQQEV